MSDRHKTVGMGGGMRKQSATGSLRTNGEHGLRAHGLVHRGAVIATYVQLDGPEAFATPSMQNPTAIYCDVLLYSSSEGMRGAALRRVLVAQDCGMHDGHSWVPRAATIDFSKHPPDPVDLTKGMNIQHADPRNLDGDHVLVQYIDDNFAQPVITKRLPHPRMGFGNESLPSAGHRMKLKLVDGQPDFWKHHGSFVGFDNDGNFIVDTTRAHSGVYDTEGNEVPLPDATHGNVTYLVNPQGTVRIVGANKFELTLKDDELHLKLQTGESFKISGKDGNTVTTLGDGAKHVAIVEQLQALYESMKTAQDLFNATHVHIDGFGSTAPSPGAAPLPAWDPTINSSKVSIPNG